MLVAMADTSALKAFLIRTPFFGGLDAHDPTKIVKMGYLAQYILDKRIPLEICLSSNVHTGAVESIEKHPFGIYHRYGFRVTLLAIPCDPRWRTPAGLALVGPGYFGYDVEYTPAEASFIQ